MHHIKITEEGLVRAHPYWIEKMQDSLALVPHTFLRGVTKSEFVIVLGEETSSKALDNIRALVNIINDAGKHPTFQRPPKSDVPDNIVLGSE